MKLTYIEIAIIGVIFGLSLLIIYIPHIPDNSKKDIPSATREYFYTIEYNGHTYVIQNFGNQSSFHNPDCTNSKCFKD